MLPLISTVGQLVSNVRAYQNAFSANSLVTPTNVSDWYYIPALGMAGAARFIAYKGTTASNYGYVGRINGGVAKYHLNVKLGWFDQVWPGDPRFTRAFSAATYICSNFAAHLQLLCISSSSSKGTPRKGAEFYVLKDEYDKQV